MPPIATSGSPVARVRGAASPHQVEPDRVVAGLLGGGAEDRTDRDVADRLEHRPRRSARRCASRARRSRRRRRCARTAGRRQIVLPDVDAVGAGQPRDVGAIVDDQRAPGADARAGRPPTRSRASASPGIVLARSCRKRAPPRRYAAARSRIGQPARGRDVRVENGDRAAEVRFRLRTAESRSADVRPLRRDGRRRGSGAPGSAP